MKDDDKPSDSSSKQRISSNTALMSKFFNEFDKLDLKKLNINTLAKSDLIHQINAQKDFIMELKQNILEQEHRMGERNK